MNEPSGTNESVKLQCFILYALALQSIIVSAGNDSWSAILCMLIGSVDCLITAAHITYTHIQWGSSGCLITAAHITYTHIQWGSSGCLITAALDIC